MPLVVLAVLSILGVIYGLPIIDLGDGHQTLMENYLSTVFNLPYQLARIHRTISVEQEGGLFGAWALAWIIALAGGGLACVLYVRYFPSRRGAPMPAPARALVRWAANGFYIDRLYDLTIVRPIKFISFVFYKVIDSLLIDTLLVRGTAWVTARLASALRLLQTGDTQSYAAVMALAVLFAAGYAVIQVLK